MKIKRTREEKRRKKMVDFCRLIIALPFRFVLVCLSLASSRQQNCWLSAVPVLFSLLFSLPCSCSLSLSPFFLSLLQSSFIEQNFLYNECRHGFAQFGSCLHDAQTKRNDLRAQQKFNHSWIINLKKEKGKTKRRTTNRRNGNKQRKLQAACGERR